MELNQLEGVGWGDDVTNRCALDLHKEAHLTLGGIRTETLVDGGGGGVLNQWTGGVKNWR